MTHQRSSVLPALVTFVLAAGALAAVAEARSAFPGDGAAGSLPREGAKGLAPEGAASGLAPPAQSPNVPYDGRFAFARVRFGSGGLRGGGWGRRGREPVWAHDYPRAETNFLKILSETTLVGLNPEGLNILALDDPELFNHPVAYIVEVGFWDPTEEEVEALRAYLEKGGFLIVDDFRGGDWLNFERQVGRILPGAQPQPLDGTAEIFDAFFRIADPHALHPPTYQQYPPMYFGVFEDNDPGGRMRMMINYNQDMAEYWEYSDYGYYPIDLSNEAYKFGVNYVVYAMTH